MAISRRLVALLHRTELAHRNRRLERDPALATWPEVEELLSRELPLRAVLDVCVRAHGRAISPATLWPWIRRHGAPLLAQAVAAGLDETDLQRHLASLHGLDLESLRMHAELNGHPMPAPVRPGLGAMAPRDQAGRHPRP